MRLRSHQAQSIIVQTVQLSKNGPNSIADGECLTISTSEQKTPASFLYLSTFPKG